MLEIAERLVQLRKRDERTQLDIATYIGVSTAAVSKWETGQSYPDIMILPKLATYYNVSIDDLLNYKAQLTKENIQALYRQLAEDFQQQPFDEVLAKINALVKEYYACFPLLMQLSILLVNYISIANEQTQTVFSLIENLCERIQKNSSELKHVQLSHSIQAQIALMQNKPAKVLAILDNQIEPYAGNDLLLAQAYLLLNNTTKADETYQVATYQKTLSIFALLTNSLQLQTTDTRKFNETIKRCLGIIDLFHLQKLHFNSCLIFYLTAAHCYLLQGHQKDALAMLEQYRIVVEKIDFPVVLHGDDYFDKIDEWIVREFDLGYAAPRDNQSIRQSLVDSVASNHAFEELQQLAEFKSIISSIRHSLGGHHFE